MSVEVNISDVVFDDDEGFFRGRGADGTVYVLRPSPEDLQAARDAIDDAEDGDHSQCARCDFEQAIQVLTYAGEFLRENYKDRPGGLNAEESALVDAARAWLADDAINRCLSEADT